VNKRNLSENKAEIPMKDLIGLIVIIPLFILCMAYGGVVWIAEIIGVEV